jgi:chromosomal replication initiation ATPase DnaA
MFPMADQLILDFPVHTAFGKSDFFRSPANALAIDMIEAWETWPMHRLVLTGPSGAGKSHLAHIWADLTGAALVRAENAAQLDADKITQAAICVEDAHRIGGDIDGETALFHIHNFAMERGSPMLITGRGPVASWGLTLPDLISRLGSAATVALDPPDDALLAAVMVKQFADRQNVVQPDLIPYLVARVERSFSAAREVAKALDTYAIARKRPINRRLAAEVLDKSDIGGA